MAIADDLLVLNDTKQNIKNAIIAKGQDLAGVPFISYHTAIENITASSSTSTEWTQAYYDDVFQTTLDNYPTEYLSLPDPASTEQVCYILVAVYNTNSNFTAFTCAGDYTVNWGDGVIENFTAGAKAEHSYDYSNVNLDSATVSNYGFKQCILTITMQSGQTLTSLDFDEYHSNRGSSQSYSITQPFLAMSVAGSSLAYLELGKSGTYVKFTLLRYFRLEQNSLTDMSSMFNNCYSLVTIPLLVTSSVTDMNNIFNNCTSLVTIPLLDTSSVTNMNKMFNYCTSLVTIPLLVTMSVTDMGNIFYNCRSLSTIPLLDTSSVTNMSSMFYNCYSLVTIPLLDTSSVTNMSSMFSYCYSLSTIPLLDTSSVTNMGNMFSYCYNLKRIQLSIRFTYNLSNFMLSAEALNEIYTNLPTKTGQTLTVTGNWGTALDDPSIATAKGWTVTG